MGFFPTEPPEPRADEADEDWVGWARFDGYTVPGAVPEPVVVASTPLVTVVATLTVSFEALDVTWHAICRRVPPGAARDQLALREVARRGPLPDGFLRLGVAYEDGRTVTNLPWDDADEREAEDDERALTWRMRGGSGTPTVSTTSVRIAPGPDAGPVTLVCEWPAMEVPERSATVPHDVLDRARLLAVSVEPIDGG